MTQPEWQFTEHSHTLLSSESPGSKAELQRLPHFTGEGTGAQEGVMCPKSQSQLVAELCN